MQMKNSTFDPEVMIAMEANEIDFVSLYRSRRTDHGAAVLLVSPENEMANWNFAGALQGETQDLDRLIGEVERFFRQESTPPCFRLTPMTAPLQLEERLRTLGYRPAIVMSNMIFTGSVKELPESAAAVRKVSTDEDILLFTELQMQGFNAPREWQARFLESNRRYRSHADHVFYVAEVDGRPAGICLLLSTGDVGGFYVVATLDAYRGRRVGQALIAQAVQDSVRRGHRITCLNTETGSHAEGFFRHMGFETAFESTFYRLDS